MKKIKNTGPIHPCWRDTEERPCPGPASRWIDERDGCAMITWTCSLHRPHRVGQAAIDRRMRADCDDWQERMGETNRNAYMDGWRAGYEAGRE